MRNKKKSRKQKFYILGGKRVYVCQYKRCKHLAEKQWVEGHYCSKHIEKVYPKKTVARKSWVEDIVDSIVKLFA